MTAHGHTAESSQRKIEKQQDVQHSGQDPVRIVSALKKNAVPFPIQDLMDDDKHRHAYPDPFMRRIPCDLISHEEEEKNGHCRIHDPFDDMI